jgi:hypothetical protein
MVKATVSKFSTLEGAPGMKKIAFAALFMGVASGGLLACGGDDDGDGIIFVDSAPVDDACNPVTQDGCADGEKCSWLVVQEDPFLGRTDCVPDGTEAVGAACTEGTPGEDTGFDNCAAGGLCLGEVCRSICNIDPDTCGEGFACSSYTQTFSDDPAENTGVCDPTCDPVAQDCEDETQGCYLQLFNGKATCARVAAGAEEAAQGDQCANNGTSCWLNGCSPGYGGFLYAGDGVPRDCTAFCTPVETYLVDPDGNGTGDGTGPGGTNEGSDPQGMAPFDCVGERVGSMPGMQCHFFQSFFVDMNNAYLEFIPGEYGFCAPRDDTYGDCRQFSEEWVLEEYNKFIEDDNLPADWPDQIAALCDADPQRCTGGCALIETLNALDEAYCAGPGEGRPACVDSAKGARIARRSIDKIWAERLIKAGLAVPKLK